jgi:signal transduction histidine kinase
MTERLVSPNPPAGSHPERRLVAWYVGLAAGWVALSDRLLGLLVRSPAAFVRGSAVKGCAFVLVTGLLGHIVLRRSFARLRRAAERMTTSDRELRRVNAALRVLGRCNETLVRATTEAELLDELCRLAVDEGGYRLAWIGFAEHDAARTVRRVAHRGTGESYLDSLRLTWGEGAPGWPCSVAIRTRRSCVANDPGADPAHAPWAEEVFRHGFQAVLSVPILYRDECLGVLGLYAGERNAFDGDVVQQFEQLAGNVAYGLVALRKHAQLRESREQSRLLTARVQSIREEEKSRIARDLHDDLGQLLTGLMVDLRWIEKRLGELAPASTEALAVLERVMTTSELAERMVGTVQRIAAELRPGALDRLGLGPALRQDARRLQERTGIACTVRLEGEVRDAADEVSTALYRIAQEALTNVVRHAEARRVEIVLSAERERLVLEIQDDGKGMGATDARSPGALGLLGMTERAATLGGEVRLERGPVGGTRVVASVPRRPTDAEGGGRCHGS